MLTRFIVLFYFFSSFQVNADTIDDYLQRGLNESDKANYTEAIKLFKKAEILASKEKSYDKLFLAKNRLGIAYFNILSYGEAFQYYLEAYNVAIKHLDKNREMVVLNNIGILFSVQKKYKKGETYYYRAYNIAKDLNDHVKQCHYAINLIAVYSALEKPQKGMKYISEVEDFLKTHDDEFLYLAAEFEIAYNLYLQKKNTEARKRIAGIYQKAKEKPDKNLYKNMLLLLAKINKEEGNYDASIYYLKKGLAIEQNLELNISFYEVLSKLYSIVKNPELALSYKDSIIETKDSLNEIQNTYKLKANEIKFEVKDYKQRLQFNQKRMKKERLFFAFFIVLIGVLVFFVIRYLKLRLLKNKQEKTIALREQHIIQLKLEKKEHRLQDLKTKAKLEKKELKDQIQQKNRTLASRALYISGRNEIIKEITKKLLNLSIVSNNKLLQSEIKKIQSHLKIDTGLKTFFAHFDEVNPGLLDAVKQKHASLNENDLRFLAYIYMNLTIKEISLILNITSVATRKRKERITNKMNLEDGVSLYDYIHGFM